MQLERQETHKYHLQFSFNSPLWISSFPLKIPVSIFTTEALSSLRHFAEDKSKILSVGYAREHYQLLLNLLSLFFKRDCNQPVQFCNQLSRGLSQEGNNSIKLITKIKSLRPVKEICILGAIFLNSLQMGMYGI